MTVTRVVETVRRGGSSSLGLKPADSVSILTVCDNVIDVFLMDEGPAHRILGRGGTPEHAAAKTMVEREVIDSPDAQHGFSALVTVTFGASQHRVLFDTGISSSGAAENLRRLGIDSDTIDVVACSHGHFDHTTGFAGLVESLGRGHVPFVVHPDFWSRRRLLIGPEPFLMPTVDRSEIDASGLEIVENTGPSLLFDRHALLTGQIERSSDFEVGFPLQEAERDGTWQPDPQTLDDQALVVHVRDRGLVVLTGCGHAGLINTIRYAQKLTGVDHLHAVMGGFHLTGPLFEPLIDRTCDELAALDPDVVVPTHCTGWRAVHAMADRMPQAFIQNSVGTSIDLEATD